MSCPGYKNAIGCVIRSGCASFNARFARAGVRIGYGFLPQWLGLLE
jgi:protein involved in ribonucleotide reduction